MDPTDTTNPFSFEGVSFLSGGQYKVVLSLPDTADRAVSGIMLSSNDSCNYPSASWATSRDEVNCATVYTGTFDWDFAYSSGRDQDLFGCGLERNNTDPDFLYFNGLVDATVVDVLGVVDVLRPNLGKE